MIALLLQRRVRVPPTLEGQFRPGVAAVYALYQFFTITSPELLLSDLLLILASYLFHEAPSDISNNNQFHVDTGIGWQADPITFEPVPSIGRPTPPPPLLKAHI
jgi:hypothetical protein